MNTSTKESSIKTSGSNLIRWAGLSAVLGGGLFVAIQPVHPPEILMWLFTAAFQFAEGLIVPLLVADAPGFAFGFEGISSGAGLAVGTLAPLGLSLLLPHAFIRLAAVPVGIALALLGYALWSEREVVTVPPTPGAVGMVGIGL